MPKTTHAPLSFIPFSKRTMVGPCAFEVMRARLENATLASLLTFGQLGDVMAFILLRDPTINGPEDMPSADLRARLRDLCGRGSILLDFLCPPPGYAPTPNSVAHCALCYLLVATLLRAAVRADGHFRLGALVAGSGVPGAPCPSLVWARAARWLDSQRLGAFRGATLPFISFAIHLSREMGIKLDAPTLSSPLEEWRVMAPPPARSSLHEGPPHLPRHSPLPVPP